MLNREKIEEILQRADIVAVISRYIQLERDGTNFRGACPFHPDDAKSFVVSPETRSFRCSSCQINGDAIRFIQRYLGRNYEDAARELGKSAGVTLQTFDPLFREKKQLQSAIDFATSHYQACLVDRAKGTKAREYLKERGIRDDMVKVFGLGWAPGTGNELAQALEKAGLLEAGVKARLIQADPKGGYADFFHGRIMIPVRTPTGRTLAFLGRLVEGEGKKYLRLFDSAIYREDQTVLGLDLAKDAIREQQSAVLVEGGFDCIWMHQLGFKNTVSVFPSSVSPARISRLQDAGARELILMLDGDEPGRRAVEWNSGSLLVHGIPTRVVSLPQGEDPDTYAMKNGAEGMKKLLAGAKPLMEHLLTETSAMKSASQEERDKGLDRVLRIARYLPMGPARAEVFSKVSERMGLQVKDMETTLRERMRTRATAARAERVVRRARLEEKAKQVEKAPTTETPPTVERAPVSEKAVVTKKAEGEEPQPTPARKTTARKRPSGGGS
ncbi:DNA primase [Cystobacter fuscus]|uniref:DNA primase n=1 Tax=Cystobacter fuscus TaxID=43 RepID=A0A250J515_9BACT|nr:DNA primase [Cystobacter fuscus]ATB39039.1 DNA primase [Cystobacter fuscus]